MIRTEYLGLVSRAFHQIGRFLIDGKIIQPPSDVLLAHSGAVAPPRVMVRIRAEVPEGIHVTRFKKTIHPGPLFREKACVVFVGLRVLQIDLAMRDIEIAAKYNRLPGRTEAFAVMKHPVAEGKFVSKPCVFSLAVRKIGVDQRELWKFSHQYPALAVDRGVADSLCDGMRFLFRVDGYTAVARLLRGMPVGVIAARMMKRLIQLLDRGLRFLETDYVCGLCFKPFQEAFGVGGAQAVHIPAEKFHEVLIARTGIQGKRGLTRLCGCSILFSVGNRATSVFKHGRSVILIRYLIGCLIMFAVPDHAVSAARPGIDLLYSFHNIETEQLDGVFARLASAYQGTVSPNLRWTSSGSNPSEFRIRASATLTRYLPPGSLIEGGEQVALFGAGAELGKEIKRASFAIGAHYDQRKIFGISAEHSAYLWTVGVPSVSFDFGLIAIGTAEKTLNFGARLSRHFGSSEANGARITDGTGAELYTGFEFTRGMGLRLSYLWSEMASSVGTIRVKEIVIGLRVVKLAFDDLGRMPLDY